MGRERESARCPITSVRRQVETTLCDLVGAALVVVTFLPLVPSHRWWIRIFDYPRWDIAVLMLLLSSIVLVRSTPPRPSRRTLLVALWVGISWDAILLWPYSPLAASEAGASPTCPNAAELRLLSLNVRQQNQHIGEVTRLILRVAPDVVLLMETNRTWEDGLGAVRAAYPHHAEQVSPNGYGIMLLSRLPLVHPRVMHLVREDVPSVMTAIRMRSGAEVMLHAVHPLPPAIGQSTADRDSELRLIGLAMRAERAAGIVVGDYNSVPWEPAVREMARLGGLADPRVGRFYLPTFRVGHPLLRVPLDQILLGRGWTLVRLDALGNVGSDHLPLLSTVCLQPAIE